MIHHLQKEAVQITEIARNMERHYLARSLEQRLEPTGEAFYDEATLLGSVAFTDDWLIVLVSDNAPGRLLQEASLVVGNGPVAFKFLISAAINAAPLFGVLRATTATLVHEYVNGNMACSGSQDEPPQDFRATRPTPALSTSLP
jgi:hypothetical protein